MYVVHVVYVYVIHSIDHTHLSQHVIHGFTCIVISFTQNTKESENPYLNKREVGRREGGGRERGGMGEREREGGREGEKEKER